MNKHYLIAAKLLQNKEINHELRVIPTAAKQTTGAPPWGRQSQMIRKGAQGGSSEMLTPARQREMDTHFMAELKRLGSDLPYEDSCDVAR